MQEVLKYCLSCDTKVLLNLQHGEKENRSLTYSTDILIYPWKAGLSAAPIGCIMSSLLLDVQRIPSDPFLACGENALICFS